MKYTAEDFRDQLAGEIDKVAAVKRIKEYLADRGYSCKIQRRKTAKGRKIYFIIAPSAENISYSNHSGSWSNESKHVIREFFPNARVTSGGSCGWTIAEY